MTRLSFLRMLGLLPATRYGSMGQAHRRPDQLSDPPPSAVAPTQSAGTLRARTVIIFGTGVNIGLFVYTGTPALGNPPQIAIVPNTTTKDPFGNLIGTSKILMQANVITESGGIFRTAAASPLIQLDGPHNAVLVYDAAAVLRETIAPVATNDGLGNTVQAGFTSYGAANTTWVRMFQQLIAFSMAGDILNPVIGENSGAILSMSSGTQAGVTAGGTLTIAPGAVSGIAEFLATSVIFDSIATPAAVSSGPQAFGSSGALACIEASGLTGRVTVGGQTAVTSTTVTGTTGNIATATIPAGDMIAGAVYELIAFGNGTMQSTILTVAAGLNSAALGVANGPAAAAFAAAAAVRWSATARFTVRTAGAGGTLVAVVDGCISQTANNLLPGTAADNTVPFACGLSATSAVNTTVSNTVNIIISTSGTTTLTAIGAYLKRVA